MLCRIQYSLFLFVSLGHFFSDGGAKVLSAGEMYFRDKKPINKTNLQIIRVFKKADLWFDPHIFVRWCVVSYPFRQFGVLRNAGPPGRSWPEDWR